MAGREHEEEEEEEDREGYDPGSAPPQLSNGTGASSPQDGREAAGSAAQQENGVPLEAVPAPTAVVAATPVLPSMPQGVTLSSIIMDEVMGAVHRTIWVKSACRLLSLPLWSL